jgi:tyrosyl-tRNA synthetase
MGGSDQWGNITAGTWLVDKRKRRQVHGLVFPLITTAKIGRAHV